MNYDDLYSSFTALFADSGEVFRTLSRSACAEESDGMHIMFSFVVIPFVLGLIKDNDSVKLTKAFDFFERMSSSESADVTEVLEFTIIENLIASGADVYDVAKTYMGENMTECSKRVEKSFKIGDGK